MRNGSSQTTRVTGLVSALFVSGSVAVTISIKPAWADEQSVIDTIAACNDAASLLEANDIDAALEEAAWCHEGLQQIKQTQALDIFPDAVDGFSGGDVINESALGMMLLTREYQQDAKSITVNLTVGGMAGLGGSLTELMNAFGGAVGAEGKKLRIQRRAVTDLSDSGSADFSVALRSGGLMSVTSTTVNAEDVIRFLREFPIAELDDALDK